MRLGDGTLGKVNGPPPVVGAGLVAAALVVLVIGLGWMNHREPEERLAVPTAGGITLPVDDEGHPVEVPPSQPATPVSFGPGGEVLRPDPVRARVIDESGQEVVVPLSPGTTVDEVTGEIVHRTTTPTTRPAGTSPTTRPSTTPTPTDPTTTQPPPTDPTTTQPTTTTTPPPTDPTTTQPPTSDPPPTGEDPGLIGGVLGVLDP